MEEQDEDEQEEDEQDEQEVEEEDDGYESSEVEVLPARKRGRPKKSTLTPSSASSSSSKPTSLGKTTKLSATTQNKNNHTTAAAGGSKHSSTKESKVQKSTSKTIAKVNVKAAGQTKTVGQSSNPNGINASRGRLQKNRWVMERRGEGRGEEVVILHDVFVSV